MGDLVIKAAASNSLKIQSDNATNVLTVGTDDSVTLGTEFKVTSTSQTFTVKGIDAAITDSQTGTTPDVADSDSGQLAIYNGSTKLWGISEHGYVLSPKQVHFWAYGGTDQDASGIETLRWDNVLQDASNSFSTSTYRFTAPVSGVYHFSYTFMTNGEHARTAYYINGTKQQQSFAKNTVYARSVDFLVKQLSAGDYVEIKIDINSSGDGNIHSNNRSWVGFLIG